MEKLFVHMASSNNHPTLNGIEFNLYFLLIHPFTDGNGRTARLLQNLYFHSYGIPPALVRHTDRVTYLRHMEDASKGFKGRSGQEEMFSNCSFGEIRFLEYSLDRIKEGAYQLYEKVNDLKRYEIDLDIRGSSKLIYGVRQTMRNCFNARNIFGQVKVDRDGSKLVVVTSANKDCLEKVLDNYKSSQVKRYKINQK